MNEKLFSSSSRWSGVKTSKDTVKRFKRRKNEKRKIKQKARWEFLLSFYGWSQEECGRKYTFSLSYCSLSPRTEFHPRERLPSLLQQPASSHKQIAFKSYTRLWTNCSAILTTLSICLLLDSFRLLSSKFFLPSKERRKIAENSICWIFS